MLAALSALEKHAHQSPKAVALLGNAHTYTYSALLSAVESLSRRISALAVKRVGVLMDNGPAWIIADLAISRVGLVSVPLPEFFSDTQREHVVSQAALDGIVTDRPAGLLAQFGAGRLRPLARIGGRDVWMLTLPASAASPVLDGAVSKITFTSGTTGQPKGVCLSEQAINSVTVSLAKLMAPTANDKHLCVLPLSVLLENIAGVYVALCRGVPIVANSAAAVGVMGGAGLDPRKFVDAIATSRATSIITIPQMLQALVELAERGCPLPDLRFVAVGGAPIARELLERASLLGLPIYEGYGLSECGSVVAVNSPGAARMGSVGRLLPHVKVSFAADGEIYISGNSFLGYLGAQPFSPQSALASGDIGYTDGDGFLYITGRKKNMFITSFGRNVAPEWVERELTAQPAIAQAVVFGESRPWSTAVIVPRPGASTEDVEGAVALANARLPDYARIGAWLSADEPFSAGNSEFTASGRPRRKQIWRRYAPRVEEVYRAKATR